MKANLSNLVSCLTIMASLVFSTLASAKTTIVAIQGLAGEEYYQRHFDEQIEKIKSASSKLTDDQNLVIFTPDSQKKSILPSLNEVTQSLGSDDLFVIYLVGHGSFDGRDYKFNISGPDITGTELIDLFAQTSSSVVLVNTSSSSGALLKLFEESFKEKQANSKPVSYTHLTLPTTPYV